MASLFAFFRAVRRLVSGGPATRPSRQGPSRQGPTGSLSPGQTGPTATVQVDPRSLSAVRFDYSPRSDRRPDPGEVVWTWVPFEEADGRGKDRPVLIVSRLNGSTCLGIALTSKAHEGDRGALRLGAGAWDLGGRASWARIDRLFRVHDGGMRREGAALDAPTYRLVTNALSARYRWK